MPDGTKYNVDNGDDIYIVNYLNANDNKKSMYSELFERYPKYFKNINDIKDFNSLVNYNMDELIQSSSLEKANIPMF